MRNLTFKMSITMARRLVLLLVAPALAAVQGCTELTEQPRSAITPDDFYKTEEEVMAGVASVYAGLRNPFALNAYYNVSEVSSDEMIVPTRGQDWYDGGRWLELDRQLWTATSPAGLEDVGGVWKATFTNIARANVVLEALDRPEVDVANKAIVQAEVRTLRAFYYYLMLDMFGGVPLVTNTVIEERARNSKAEIFDFIASELNATRTVLPASRPLAQSGRLTSAAAEAILASLYLNAGVMRRDNASATQYNSCQAVQLQGGPTACDLAISAVDRILAIPTHTLQANWRSNFTADNEQSREILMAAKHVAAGGEMGMNFAQRALHYNQVSPDAWNGFSTIADVYNAFDNADRRKEIFLVGPQVHLDPQNEDRFGLPVNDRSGARLSFTPTIANVESATESEGARMLKWPIDPNHNAQDHGNDFTWFRLAEMLMIKAEAQNELGLTAAAIATMNQTINGVTIRSRVNMPPFAAATPAEFRTNILRERLFELAGEAKRRMDLIRHGRYTAAWLYKAARPDHVILMPIPQTQRDANTLLDQNPGY
jgi:hypothetical protein